MAPELTTVERGIVELIEATVRTSMSRYPLRAVKIRPGEDHYGDPVIFVIAEYDRVDEPIELSGTLDLITLVNDKLWERGERRFAHIRHNFDEQQKFKSRRREKA